MEIAVKKSWLKNYNLAKIYYEHHKNLEISKNFKTINGYEYDKNGFSLGKWIYYQRIIYRKKQLSEWQIMLLNNIKMRFENLDSFQNIWMAHYELAKNYYKYYGHLNIPQRFKTTNGVDYDENGFGLGAWLNTNRQQKNNNLLSEIQIALLDKLEMRWEYVNNIIWMKNYNLALEYFKHYHHLEIPRFFKTKNGIDYDDSEGCIYLGNWLSTQREVYHKKCAGDLSQEQINLLNKINMRWDYIDRMDNWMKNYKYTLRCK